MYWQVLLARCHEANQTLSIALLILRMQYQAEMRFEQGHVLCSRGCLLRFMWSN